MEPTSEDTETIVYVDGGVKHTVYKTVPPKLVVEIDFSDTRLQKNVIWELVKLTRENQTKLI